MKKLLLIIFGALLISGAQAQVLFQESFSAGTVPVPGWLIMGNADNFACPQSSNAGGTAPELQFDNDPVFPTTTMRIISPQINTTGATQVIIRFKHKFLHAAGSTAVNLSVNTRSSNGSWNSVWTAAATADIPAEGQIIVVNNANVGSASFQLSFALNGSSQTSKSWFIDDVEVLIPQTLDGAINSCSVPTFFVGQQTVEGQFANLGTTPINSIDVSWRVDEGDIHTTSLTGLNVPMGGTGDYVSPDILDLTQGNYDLAVWVSNVNGQPVDNNPANDTLVKALNIPDHITYYKPLFEEFTSSTCGPCATFNNGTFNPWLAQYTDEDLTLIKYQMNWPGSGDPYYTAEGGQRRTYYGVNAVPDLKVDGNTVSTSGGANALNVAYNATAGQICNYDIQSTHEIQGNMVIIDANIIPYESHGSTKVYLAVIEKITTQNVATNGETEFHHVMMDMVPDGNGNSVNLVANQPVNLKFNIDMSTTNVEEMDDLMLALFIQDGNKDVLQSGYSVEVGASVSSSIADGAIDVPVNQPIIVNFSQPIRMIGGAAITNSNVADIINFRMGDPTGAPVEFTATINAAKTQITITPNANLAWLQRYYLNILPVENTNSVPTLNYEITFTTVLNVGVNDLPLSELSLYPNPVSSTLYLNKADNVKTIEIYNIVGNLIKKYELNNVTGQYGINVSNMPSGLYILKAKGVQDEKAVRFIISK